MQFDPNSVVPLYDQMASEFTAGILSGAFAEGTQLPSTTAVAKAYALNPATVLRGMNQLVDAGLVEKRRGVGMFVLPGAQAKVKESRKQAFFTEQVARLVATAKDLDVAEAALIAAVKEEYEHE